MKPKEILVYGAGAIGCVVAARLILAGHKVTIFARGKKKELIEKEGIHLIDLLGEYNVKPFAVIDENSPISTQDYIFIATKFNALINITPKLAKYIRVDTVIVPLMNGIPFWYFYGLEDQAQPKQIKSLDPDGYLVKYFPLQHLIGAVVFITAQQIGENTVKSNNPYLLIFGEPNHQYTERLKALIDIFEQTNIEARPVDNIRDQIWTKVMANLSSNPMSVIANTTLNQIYSHPYLVKITETILYEVRALAACYGARINFDPKTFMHLGAEMGEIYTSMWHDFQKRQTLELAPIAEAVFELADHYDCPMPITRHIYDLTKYISEQSLQGMTNDAKQ